MPRSNIARVFAPTLVASIAMTDMDSAMRDTKRSAKVVECLLDLPPSYWHNMLNPHDECSSPTPYSHDEAPHTPGTPEMLKGRYFSFFHESFLFLLHTNVHSLSNVCACVSSRVKT